uniref:Uncharacterized protein n=1 Tax=Arundo donax TaxID=35708 RepID=A0A0A9EHN9_ARUDO
MICPWAAITAYKGPIHSTYSAIITVAILSVRDNSFWICYIWGSFKVR